MDTPLSIRQLIIAKYQENIPQIIISQQLNVPKSTVNDILKKFRQGGAEGPSRRGKCGRTRVFTVKDDRRLALASSKHPQATARQLQHAVGGVASEVSLPTIRRSLVRSGKLAYRPLKSPLLSKSQMNVRLRWARAHAHWTVDTWKKVSYQDS